jgi:nascent polypeptide-associated complex subunit alpha
MMPNLDPRAMKSMMAKMGIKSEEIDASKVVIETPDRSIVIESPQVTKIEMQGTTSFQISGSISEVAKGIEAKVTDSDIDFVMEKTGVEDRELVKETLEKDQGDIARAILDLSNGAATLP